MRADEDSFVEEILRSELSRLDQVIGLLWFRDAKTHGSEETSSELLRALESRGMPKQSRTSIQSGLARSKFVSRGKSEKSVRLVHRYAADLATIFEPFLEKRPVEIQNEYLPKTSVPNRRYYLSLVWQINGSYQYGFYDGSAVLLRRLLETLLIDLYLEKSRLDDLKANGELMMLDGILRVFAADKTIHKSRNLLKSLREVKSVGDRAAHRRTYLTDKNDLDDLKSAAKSSIVELVDLAGLTSMVAP